MKNKTIQSIDYQYCNDNKRPVFTNAKVHKIVITICYTTNNIQM